MKKFQVIPNSKAYRSWQNHVKIVRWVGLYHTDTNLETAKTHDSGYIC